MEIKKDVETFEERLLRFCFANCFTVGNLINIILLYTGIGFVSDSMRQILFIGFMLLFMAISFWYFVKMRRNLKLSHKTYLILTVLIAYYVYGVSYSLVKFGLTPTWKDYVPKLIVFGVPCFLFGIIGTKKNLINDFMCYLEKGSIIVLPVATYYAVVHWFGIANMNWDYGRAVGPLGYMYLANSFMPYMLAHMYSFLFEDKREIEWLNWRVPVSQRIRAIIIGIYWIAILASGTRGIMLSSAISMIIMVLVKLLWKSESKHIWLPVSLILLALFLGFVWSPIGMSEDGIHRWDAFVEGAKKGKFETSTAEVFENEEQLREYIDNKSSKLDGLKNKNAVTEESEDSMANGIDTNQFAREELFKLAIEEFKRHPIAGIGPMVYSIKYGGAPHAIVLEVLCETGIIGAVIYIGCIGWVLVTWIFRRKKTQEEVLLLCFLSTYIFKLNISGFLWCYSEVILYAMAIGACLIESYEKESKYF